VQPYWRKKEDLRAKLAALTPPVMIRVCTVTLGEIEFGHRATRTTNQGVRDEYTAWINDVILPHALPVSVNTRLYYAMILEDIWKKNPAGAKVKTEVRLADLGVDINDVWAVAVAWEHGLTFCTTDKMRCIREATDGNVIFDCWL
jgi:predicted nucleic acid-binding protein